MPCPTRLRNQSRRRARPDHQALHEADEEAARRGQTPEQAVSRGRQLRGRQLHSRRLHGRRFHGRLFAHDDDDDDDDPDALESLPPSAVIRSPVRTRVLGAQVDEIAESPADAPGSGRRRTVQSSGVTNSTARLQEAVNAEESSQTTSSPLARKTRQSDAAASSRSATASRIQPSRLIEFDAEDDAEEEQEEEGSPESQQEEEVDEIEDAEAARVLGRKRPRRSMQERSPELGSGPMDDEEEPAPKRKTRAVPSKSPSDAEAARSQEAKAIISKIKTRTKAEVNFSAQALLQVQMRDAGRGRQRRSRAHRNHRPASSQCEKQRHGPAELGYPLRESEWRERCRCAGSSL